MSRINPVKFGERERLDSHHKAILSFIKNNPESTENQIVKAMDAEPKGPSKMTTLRKLDELIEKQEISDLLKEGERGFHRFIINENNDFAKIDKTLTQIETTIDIMYEHVEKIMSMGQPDTIRKIPDRWIVRELHDDFLGGYEQAIDNMLEVLLCLVSYKIHSEKDAWSLYQRIIKSKIMVNEQLSIFEAKGIEHKFLSSNNLIWSSGYDLKRINEKFSQDDLNYANKNGIPIAELTTDLISMIKNFKNNFLKDYP